METSTSTASSSASAPSSASSLAQEELWNILLLQHEAIQSRLREFHQQVEAFVQLTATNPLTGARQTAAHAPPVELRERSVPSIVPQLISETAARLATKFCDARGALKDSESLPTFTKGLMDPALTLEDQAQMLFVLDQTFRSADSAGMSAAFEKERGYEALLDWFASACAYQDDAHKTFSRMLLQFLQQHKPSMKYARKTVLMRLRQLQPFAVGRQTKLLIKETAEKYRE
ncbi:hypothetical protein PINS_up016577 [Pythium insidiosum]|nr:hypothetical protein PINS_up016577 [Pythium insidiosum]